MALIPHPKREDFDCLIQQEFDELLERHPSISTRLKDHFEPIKHALTEKVRGIIQAKLEIGMRPDVRKEAASEFELWLNELLLNRFTNSNGSD